MAALVLVFLYLVGAGAVLVMGIVATGLVLKEAPAGMPKAEVAKTQAAGAPAEPNPVQSKSPIWVAPTRQYQSASPAAAEAGVARQVSKQKSRKESSKGRKKQAADSKRRAPAEPALGYAQEPAPSFPLLNRD